MPTIPSTKHERIHWRQGASVVGIDEVGRGAWAGPVTVGAVALNPNDRIRGLRDSKQLSANARTRLAATIESRAVATAIGHASNLEIDQLGLSSALQLAAHRALQSLTIDPQVVLIDGPWNFVAQYATTSETIVRGDQVCASIAAASIVAKVARDTIISSFDGQFPAYDFASNKGYPSPKHRQALWQVGPCSLHRHSWKPIAKLAQGELFDVVAHARE